MEKLIRYLRFIREAERLKNVLRTAYTSEGRHESTAEHSWRLALLAAVLTGERPELDMQRVVLMCLIHDLGEAFDGDVPAIAQTAPGVKAASELAAMEQRYEVARMLDRGMIYSDILAETSASSATISRVNRCLTGGTGGYERAFAKVDAEEKK